MIAPEEECSNAQKWEFAAKRNQQIRFARTAWLFVLLFLIYYVFFASNIVEKWMYKDEHITGFEIHPPSCENPPDGDTCKSMHDQFCAGEMTCSEGGVCPVCNITGLEELTLPPWVASTFGSSICQLCPNVPSCRIQWCEVSAGAETCGAQDSRYSSTHDYYWRGNNISTSQYTFQPHSPNGADGEALSYHPRPLGFCSKVHSLDYSKVAYDPVSTGSEKYVVTGDPIELVVGGHDDPNIWRYLIDSSAKAARYTCDDPVHASDFHTAAYVVKDIDTPGKRCHENNLTLCTTRATCTVGDPNLVCPTVLVDGEGGAQYQACPDESDGTLLSCECKRAKQLERTAVFHPSYTVRTNLTFPQRLKNSGVCEQMFTTHDEYIVEGAKDHWDDKLEFIPMNDGTQRFWVEQSDLREVCTEARARAPYMSPEKCGLFLGRHCFEHKDGARTSAYGNTCDQLCLDECTPQGGFTDRWVIFDTAGEERDKSNNLGKLLATSLVKGKRLGKRSPEANQWSALLEADAYMIAKFGNYDGTLNATVTEDDSNVTAKMCGSGWLNGNRTQQPNMRRCVFPFDAGGVTYHNCTYQTNVMMPTGRSADVNGEICATEVDADGKMTAFGECLPCGLDKIEHVCKMDRMEEMKAIVEAKRYDRHRLPFLPLHFHLEHCSLEFKPAPPETNCKARVGEGIGNNEPDNCFLTWEVVGQKGTTAKQILSGDAITIHVKAPAQSTHLKGIALTRAIECVVHVYIPAVSMGTGEAAKMHPLMTLPDLMITSSPFISRKSDHVDDKPTTTISAPRMPLDFGAQKLVVRGSYASVRFKALRLGYLDVDLKHGDFEVMQLVILFSTVHNLYPDRKGWSASGGTACSFPFTAFWPDGRRSVHTECSPVTRTFAAQHNGTTLLWCSTKPYYMRFEKEEQFETCEMGEWSDWHANDDEPKEGEDSSCGCYFSEKGPPLASASMAGATTMTSGGVSDYYGGSEGDYGDEGFGGGYSDDTAELNHNWWRSKSIKKITEVIMNTTASFHEILNKFPRGYYNLRTRGVKHVVQSYKRIEKACVNGNMLQLISGQTVDECEALCNKRTDCAAFEFGTDHGDEPGDCQLKFRYEDAEREECPWVKFDLYVKVVSCGPMYEIKRCPNTCKTTPAPTATGRRLAAINLGCEVSEWGAWSSCSRTCGSGTQIRMRKITQKRKGEGAPCPQLQEHKACADSLPHCLTYHQSSTDPEIEDSNNPTLHDQNWGFCGPSGVTSDGKLDNTTTSIKLAQGSAWVNLVEGAKFQFDTHGAENHACLRAPRIGYVNLSFCTDESADSTQGGQAFEDEMIFVLYNSTNSTNTSGAGSGASNRTSRTNSTDTGFWMKKPAAEASVPAAKSALQCKFKTFWSLSKGQGAKAPEPSAMPCKSGCSNCVCDVEGEDSPDDALPLIYVDAPQGQVFSEVVKCNDWNSKRCRRYGEQSALYDSTKDQSALYDSMDTARGSIDSSSVTTTSVGGDAAAGGVGATLAGGNGSASNTSITGNTNSFLGTDGLNVTNVTVTEADLNAEAEPAALAALIATHSPLPTNRFGFDDASQLEMNSVQREVEMVQGYDFVNIIEINSPGINVGKFMFSTKKQYTFMPFPEILLLLNFMMNPVVARSNVRIVPGTCPMIDMRLSPDGELHDATQSDQLGQIWELLNATINVNPIQRLTLLTYATTPDVDHAKQFAFSAFTGGSDGGDQMITHDKESWYNLGFERVGTSWQLKKLELTSQFTYLLIIVLSLLSALSGAAGVMLIMVKLETALQSYALKLNDNQAEKVTVLTAQLQNDPQAAKPIYEDIAPNIRVRNQGERSEIKLLSRFPSGIGMSTLFAVFRNKDGPNQSLSQKHLTVPLKDLKKGGRYFKGLGLTNLFQHINNAVNQALNRSTNSLSQLMSALKKHPVEPVDYDGLAPVELSEFTDEYNRYCSRHMMQVRSLDSTATIKLLNAHGCKVVPKPSDKGTNGYQFLKLKNTVEKEGEDEDDGEGLIDKNDSTSKVSPVTEFLESIYEPSLVPTAFVRNEVIEQEYADFCRQKSIPSHQQVELCEAREEVEKFGARYTPDYKELIVTGLARKSEVQDIERHAMKQEHHRLDHGREKRECMSMSGCMSVCSTPSGKLLAILLVGILLSVTVDPAVVFLVPLLQASGLLMFTKHPQLFWLFMSALMPLVVIFGIFSDGLPYSVQPLERDSSSELILWYLVHLAWVLPDLQPELGASFPPLKVFTRESFVLVGKSPLFLYTCCVVVNAFNLLIALHAHKDEPTKPHHQIFLVIVPVLVLVQLIQVSWWAMLQGKFEFRKLFSCGSSKFQVGDAVQITTAGSLMVKMGVVANLEWSRDQQAEENASRVQVKMNLKRPRWSYSAKMDLLTQVQFSSGDQQAEENASCVQVKMNLLSPRWTYSVKMDLDGSIERYRYAQSEMVRHVTTAAAAAVASAAAPVHQDAKGMQQKTHAKAVFSVRSCLSWISDCSSIVIWYTRLFVTIALIVPSLSGYSVSETLANGEKTTTAFDLPVLCVLLLTLILATVCVWFRGRHAAAYPHPTSMFVKVFQAETTSGPVSVEGVLPIWIEQLKWFVVFVRNKLQFWDLFLVISNVLFIFFIPAFPLMIVMYAQLQKGVYSPYPDSSLRVEYLRQPTPSLTWNKDFITLPAWIHLLDDYAIGYWGVAIAYWIWGLIEIALFNATWDLGEPYVPMVWTPLVRFMHRTFLYLTIFIGGLNITHVILWCIWMVLAAVLNPERFLPMAVMVTVQLGFIANQWRNLKKNQKDMKKKVKVEVFKQIVKRVKYGKMGEQMDDALGEGSMDAMIESGPGGADKLLAQALAIPQEIVETLRTTGNVQPLLLFIAETHSADPLMVEALVATMQRDSVKAAVLADKLGVRFSMPDKMLSSLVQLCGTATLPKMQQEHNIAASLQQLITSLFQLPPPEAKLLVSAITLNQSKMLTDASELIKSRLGEVGQVLADPLGAPNDAVARMVDKMIGCGEVIPMAGIVASKWMLQSGLTEELKSALTRLVRDVMKLPKPLATLPVLLVSIVDEANQDNKEGREGLEISPELSKEMRVQLMSLVQMAIPSLDSRLLEAVATLCAKSDKAMQCWTPRPQDSINPMPLLQLVGLDTDMYAIVRYTAHIALSANKHHANGDKAAAWQAIAGLCGFLSTQLMSTQSQLTRLLTKLLVGVPPKLFSVVGLVLGRVAKRLRKKAKAMKEAQVVEANAMKEAQAVKTKAIKEAQAVVSGFESTLKTREAEKTRILKEQSDDRAAGRELEVSLDKQREHVRELDKKDRPFESRFTEAKKDGRLAMFIEAKKKAEDELDRMVKVDAHYAKNFRVRKAARAEELTKVRGTIVGVNKDLDVAKKIVRTLFNEKAKDVPASMFKFARAEDLVVESSSDDHDDHDDHDDDDDELSPAEEMRVMDVDTSAVQSTMADFLMEHHDRLLDVFMGGPTADDKDASAAQSTVADFLTELLGMELSGTVGAEIKTLLATELKALVESALKKAEKVPTPAEAEANWKAWLKALGQISKNVPPGAKKFLKQLNPVMRFVLRWYEVAQISPDMPELGTQALMCATELLSVDKSFDVGLVSPVLKKLVEFALTLASGNFGEVQQWLLLQAANTFEQKALGFLGKTLPPSLKLDALVQGLTEAIFSAQCGDIPIVLGEFAVEAALLTTRKVPLPAARKVAAFMSQMYRSRDQLKKTRKVLEVFTSGALSLKKPQQSTPESLKATLSIDLMRRERRKSTLSIDLERLDPNLTATQASKKQLAIVTRCAWAASVIQKWHQLQSLRRKWKSIRRFVRASCARKESREITKKQIKMGMVEGLKALLPLLPPRFHKMGDLFSKAFMLGIGDLEFVNDCKTKIRRGWALLATLKATRNGEASHTTLAVAGLKLAHKLLSTHEEPEFSRSGACPLAAGVLLARNANPFGVVVASLALGFNEEQAASMQAAFATNRCDDFSVLQALVGMADEPSASPARSLSARLTLFTMARGCRTTAIALRALEASSEAARVLNVVGQQKSSIPLVLLKPQQEKMVRDLLNVGAVDQSDGRACTEALLGHFRLPSSHKGGQIPWTEAFAVLGEILQQSIAADSPLVKNLENISSSKASESAMAAKLRAFNGPTVVANTVEEVGLCDALGPSTHCYLAEMLCREFTHAGVRAAISYANIRAFLKRLTGVGVGVRSVDLDWGAIAVDMRLGGLLSLSHICIKLWHFKKCTKSGEYMPMEPIFLQHVNNFGASLGITSALKPKLDLFVDAFSGDLLRLFDLRIIGNSSLDEPVWQLDWFRLKLVGGGASSLVRLQEFLIGAGLIGGKIGKPQVPRVKVARELGYCFSDLDINSLLMTTDEFDGNAGRKVQMQAMRVKLLCSFIGLQPVTLVQLAGTLLRPVSHLMHGNNNKWKTPLFCHKKAVLSRTITFGDYFHDTTVPNQGGHPAYRYGVVHVDEKEIKADSKSPLKFEYMCMHDGEAAFKLKAVEGLDVIWMPKATKEAKKEAKKEEAKKEAMEETKKEGIARHMYRDRRYLFFSKAADKWYIGPRLGSVPAATLWAESTVAEIMVENGHQSEIFKDSVWIGHPSVQCRIVKAEVEVIDAAPLDVRNERKNRRAAIECMYDSSNDRLAALVEDVVDWKEKTAGVAAAKDVSHDAAKDGTGSSTEDQWHGHLGKFLPPQLWPASAPPPPRFHLASRQASQPQANRVLASPQETTQGTTDKGHNNKDGREGRTTKPRNHMTKSRIHTTMIFLKDSRVGRVKKVHLLIHCLQQQRLPSIR
jgi:hypothetical protein